MKKYTFVLPLIFILGLAYWRYTYIINPNFVGEPLLIKIRSLNHYDPAPIITANSIINIKSIIIYWLLFFLGNVALFLTLFSSFEKVKTIGFFYLLLSFFSAVFFALDAFWLKSLISFNLASILKNFLLSPLFTAIAYIMIEYFHSFGKPS
ncbi:MAG: hypothetical protein KAI99_07605 [Cyclobacteriaceae bacterium]|nr:hypothetical protein [Cyclobacteriaceae bacterium]